jgi:NTE family protein
VKRAAVFSGGGVKGAFQVGALWETLLRSTERFDGFFGVSTGALTAAVMAQYSTRPEQICGADRLYSTYMHISGNRDIYSGWNWLPANLARWYFGRAIYNPKGLAALLTRSVEIDRLRKSGVAFGCGVTELESGNYVSINQHVLFSLDQVLASGSMPIYFPAVPVGNSHLLDGGVRSMTPMREATRWLKTQGPGPHSLTVFLASPRTLAPYTGSPRGVQAAARVLDMIETEIYLHDLKLLTARNAAKAADDVEIHVTLIEPTQVYGSALDFNPRTIATMLTDGQVAARTPVIIR